MLKKPPQDTYLIFGKKIKKPKNTKTNPNEATINIKITAIF